jgi:hypothetical protein
MPRGTREAFRWIAAFVRAAVREARVIGNFGSDKSGLVWRLIARRAIRDRHHRAGGR